MINMSKRPSDQYRNDCEYAQSCTTACNYIVIGGGLASNLYVNRLLRNGIKKSIILVSQGADRTNDEGILSTRYPVLNARNTINNLQGITVQLLNSNTGSDFTAENTNSNPNGIIANLTESQVITSYIPSGILGDTLGAYKSITVGPWFSTLSSQSSNRVENLAEQLATPIPFNKQEKEWAHRISALLNVPFTSTVNTRTPSILDHNETFVKSSGRGTIREIGLEINRQIARANNVSILANSRNISAKETGTPGLYNVTIDGTTYPYSKLAFKNNVFSYLQISNVGGIPTGAVSIPTPYRAVIPIPITGSGFVNSEFYSKLPWGSDWNDGWMGSNLSSVGNGWGSGCGCGKGSSENRTRDLCSCGTTGNSGNTGYTTGIDFSSATPGPDLVYANLALSLDNPVTCNRKKGINGPTQWNLQAYITSDDLYNTSPEGKYAKAGYLLFILDGQHLNNQRIVNYNPDGNQLNVSFNSDASEFAASFEFATIVSAFIYALTTVKIPPLLLLKQNSMCTANGECSSVSAIVNYGTNQSTMERVIELATILYGNSVSTANPSATLY